MKLRRIQNYLKKGADKERIRETMKKNKILA
jgi:hypothetical protein